MPYKFNPFTGNFDEVLKENPAEYIGKNYMKDPLYDSSTAETRGYKELSFFNNGGGGFTDGGGLGLIIAFPAHGITQGQKIFYYTSADYLNGAGSIIGVECFANVLDANTFGLSLTNGGANAPLSDGGGVNSTHYFRVYTTPAHFAMSIDTSAPQANLGSIKMTFTNDANSAVGEGFEFNTRSIDKEDFGKNAYWRTSANATSANYVSNDLIFKAVDKTNSRLINLFSGYQIQKISSDYLQTLSTTSTTKDVMVSVECAVDSAAGNYDVLFGTFRLGVDTPVPGAIITPWQSYTPTFTSFGTVTGSAFEWRRVGDTLEVRGNFNVGTTTGSEARISFPDGLVAASSLPSISASEGLLYRNNAVATNAKIFSVLREAGLGYFTFGMIDIASATSPLTKRVGTGIAGGGELLSMTGSVKIQGWDAGAMLSTTETMFKGARARYTTTAGQSFSSGATTIVDFGTKVWDDLSNVTTGASWKFTALTRDKYKVTPKVSFPVAAASAASLWRLQIYKNNVLYSAVDAKSPYMTSAQNLTLTGSDEVILDQGEFLDVRVTQNDGTRGLETTAGWNFITIEQMFDPKVFSVYGQRKLDSSVNTSSVTVSAAANAWGLVSGWTITLPETGEYDLFLDTSAQIVISGGTFYADMALSTSTTPGSGLIGQGTSGMLDGVTSVGSLHLKRLGYVATGPTTLYVHARPRLHAGGSTFSSMSVRNDIYAGGGTIQYVKVK